MENIIFADNINEDVKKYILEAIAILKSIQLDIKEKIVFSIAKLKKALGQASKKKDVFYIELSERNLNGCYDKILNQVKKAYLFDLKFSLKPEYVKVSEYTNKRFPLY